MKSLILVALTWFVGPAVLVAQEEQAEATELSSEQNKVHFESPAEAVRNLIEGIRERTAGGLKRAASTLDLSGVAEADRASRGRELAHALKEDVLDRLGTVRYAEITKPTAEGPGSQRVTWKHGDPDVRQVTFEFVQKERGWVFAPSLVKRIDELAGELADLAITEEIYEELPLLDQLRMRLRSRMPSSLLSRGFLLENWQWLAILVLLFLGVVGDRIVRVIFSRIAKRIAKSSRIQIDGDDLTNFERPFGIVVTAGLFVWLLPAIGVELTIERVLDLAGSVVLVFAGIWSAYRLVDVLSGFLTAKADKTSNKFDDMLVPLLRRTLKLLISVVGLVFIASRLSEDVWHILAGLSIGSLAVGFAAKDSIENLFGTFTVLMDKPFQLGDWITVGEIDGSVEEVGFRSTRVRTFYNSVITVPNSRFISAHIDNMGERVHRRVKTTLSLTYDTPAEKVESFCEGVRELVRQHPYTRKDTFYVYFNAWNASSIDILLYAFLTCPDWGTELREKHRLYCDILRLAGKLGVDFAFPTQTLHIAKPEDLEHPNMPETASAGVAEGRAAAEEIARGSLAGFSGMPPAFDIQDRDTQSCIAPKE